MPCLFTTVHVLAVGAPLPMAAAALRHVTLETAGAPTDGTHESVRPAVNGCDAQPTHTVRVQIPEGFIAVKPMPEPGRTVETERGPHARADACSGDERGEGLDEVVGSGRELRDEHDAEFVSGGRVADLPAGRVLGFETVPTGANGAARRIELPTQGQRACDLEHPASGLEVVACEDRGHRVDGAQGPPPASPTVA